MRTDRKIAIIIGALYLIANIAGPIGYGIELPILDAPDYLANISANETEWLLGALLELVMAVALAGIGIAVYPVLRRQNENLAIGYVASRIIECMILILGVIASFTLLTLSHEYIASGASNVPYFQTLGELLQKTRDWGGHVVMDVAVFPLGALILYAALYHSKRIPRWLSGWGLISAVLYWAAGMLVMFDIIVPLATPHIILQAPLGVQELAFALWLIVKGFTPAKITTAPGS